jgi:hypothetical protein
LPVAIAATMLWSGLLPPYGQPAYLEKAEQKVAQVAPPPPASVPDNASVITATVRKYAIWPPGSLKETFPTRPLEETRYSLTIEIHTTQPQSSGLDSLARPGMVIETFSAVELSSDLVGKTIEATLRLTGDSYGVRWQISKVRALQ